MMRGCIYLIFALLLFNCSSKKEGGDSESKLTLVRFDCALYRYLTLTESENALASYQDFIDVYGEKVLGVGRSDSAGFYTRLRDYFSDSTLMQVYGEVQSRFRDLTSLQSELSAGMAILYQHFPQLSRPQVYLHVSGWGQNIVVTDKVLSLSADKYLGTDYPLYSKFFYDYQRQNMAPQRMAPDYLLGFLMANFPFRGNEAILLDRMIYEGKLRYFLFCALPQRMPCESVGYTPDQYAWCERYCNRIWKSVLDNRHLFHPDYSTTAAYFRDAPFTPTLPSDAPARVGQWLGFQIVRAYMKRRPDTDWQALMDQTDYVKFLQESHFNPITGTTLFEK
jgi:hypothetical protein